MASRIVAFWCRFFHARFHSPSGQCHKCHRALFGVIWICLLVAPLHAQENRNFDKTISGTDKMIVVQPPEGKTWTLIQGSLALEHPIWNATVVVFTETGPFGPYRDPDTGEMRGCQTCVNILHADAGRYVFFPIIGGSATPLSPYGAVLHGQTRDIVLTYPARLGIIITPPHGGFAAPFKAYVRFSVIER